MKNDILNSVVKSYNSSFDAEGYKIDKEALTEKVVMLITHAYHIGSEDGYDLGYEAGFSNGIDNLG
jgi:hypothetical protein